MSGKYFDRDYTIEDEAPYLGILISIADELAESNRLKRLEFGIEVDPV